MAEAEGRSVQTGVAKFGAQHVGMAAQKIEGIGPFDGKIDLHTVVGCDEFKAQFAQFDRIEAEFDLLILTRPRHRPRDGGGQIMRQTPRVTVKIGVIGLRD